MAGGAAQCAAAFGLDVEAPVANDLHDAPALEPFKLVHFANLVGNGVATVVVAKWCKQLDEKQLQDTLSNKPGAGADKTHRAALQQSLIDTGDRAHQEHIRIRHIGGRDGPPRQAANGTVPSMTPNACPAPRPSPSRP